MERWTSACQKKQQQQHTTRINFHFAEPSNMSKRGRMNSTKKEHQWNERICRLSSPSISISSARKEKEDAPDSTPSARIDLQGRKACGPVTRTDYFLPVDTNPFVWHSQNEIHWSILTNQQRTLHLRVHKESNRSLSFRIITLQRLLRNKWSRNMRISLKWFVCIRSRQSMLSIHRQGRRTNGWRSFILVSIALYRSSKQRDMHRGFVGRIVAWMEQGGKR